MGLSQASVAIVLVNWNGYQLTKDCLLSLRKVNYSNFSTIVVNNGCEDVSVEALPKEFHEVHFIHLPSNQGFTGGNNVGFQKAKSLGAEFILLLNNDTEVEPDFLTHLVDTYRQQPGIGMVQPLILFNKRRDIVWSAGGRFFSWLGYSKTYFSGQVHKKNNAYPTHLDWATGCCVLISAEILEQVGGLTPSYFAYFEDVDWSLKVKKLGYQIRLAPQSMIYHEAGASSKSTHKEGTLSPKVFYLHARNQLFLIRNHLPLFAKGSSLLFQLSKYFLWLVYFCGRRRWNKAKFLIKGIKDGFVLNPMSDTPLCP